MQEYQSIRFQINEDVVNMRVHVRDLRAVLGLPEYDLYAPFRAPEISTAPVDNISDCDHAEND